MTKVSQSQVVDFLLRFRLGEVADIGGAGNEYVYEPLGLVPTMFDLKTGYDVCQKVLPRKFPTIVCMDVLEHVNDPVRAAENIGYSLADGGHIFLTTVFTWPIHNFPVDMYRFTDQALKWLFRDLLLVDCWFADDESGQRVSIIAQRT